VRYLIHHALDQSASRRPEAVAFRFEDSSITYAECTARSNQLARALINLGVNRGDRVGIYLNKSLESAVAVYGIMKAGAAYVPIDPRLPQETLAYLLENCEIECVVAAKAQLPMLSRVAGDTRLRAVVGASDMRDDMPFETLGWKDVAEMSDGPVRVATALIESDLAYIMYTSGSTGRPKGIMHTHRSGLSYAEAAAETYGVSSDDILGNHSHLHFDMSTFDYFSGPLRGATTVIIPQAHMLLPASLSQLIEDEQLTIWYSVSSALVDLLLRGSLEDRNLESLRWIMFGGEPFPPAHLRDLMAMLPHARFSNVYGPAEVNQCTYFHVPALPNEYEQEQVPIGCAWDIAESLVVDENDDVVPAGEQGELLINAPTMMQGYWKDVQRTGSAMFRTAPYQDSPFEKVFLRTGDLVVADESGHYRFLGRKDRQVKFRGFRVELDGIEAVLTRHPAVAEAAVWVSAGDAPSILSAVLLRDDAPGEVGNRDLLRHARENLPYYAVPTRLVVMERFPRTGSGKIDRRAIQSIAEAPAHEEEVSAL
jgi:amino acid adenylation domain-containing protein